MTLCDQLHMNWLVSEIDFNSFIHSSISLLVCCLSIDLFWLIDWIGLRWEMERKNGRRNWHLTDIGWLRIVCAVEMKVGLVWLISFDWLIDEIDWWIESANYQLWIKQTNKQQITRNKQTNKQSRSKKQTTLLSFIHLIDWLVGSFVNWFWFVSELRECDLIGCWLIDWLTKETHWRWMSWKGKVWLIQWDKSMNEWMNELVYLILFYWLIDCQIELIEMNEKALNALWLSSC